MIGSKNKGGKNNKKNLILVLIVLLIMGLPLLLLAILIAERMVFCRLLIILMAGIYFLIIIAALIYAYSINRSSSNATKTTIENLVNNFKINKYGIITANIKKVYSTKEEIKNQELLNSAKNVKRIGDVGYPFRFGVVISSFRDYQISDGTKIIRIKGLTSYPKFEVGKEITVLCKIKKSKNQFYLRFIKNIVDDTK